MTDSDQTPRFREAYQKLVDEIRKVQDTELVIINIDVPTAITTVLGALPAIRRVRAQILTEIPSYDLARFDHLEDCTLALGHAHVLYLTASAPEASIEALASTAADKRGLLLSDATALSQRGLMNGQRLKDLKGPVGYRNLAFDLFMLAALLRENLQAIAGKTAAQPAELDEAETLADRLITAVGIREQAPAVLAEATDIRQRAFALFLGVYDHVRRVVGYLRWPHGDQDEIAPSLYAGRASRRKAEPAPTQPTPPVAAPASPPLAQPHTNGAASAGFPDSQPFTQA